jgi:hypothetical protein
MATDSPDPDRSVQAKQNIRLEISAAERERRKLFLKLTNRFFEPPAVHRDSYSHTGPNSPEAVDLPQDIDIPLRSDEESVPLPPRTNLRDELKFG